MPWILIYNWSAKPEINYERSAKQWFKDDRSAMQ